MNLTIFNGVFSYINIVFIKGFTAIQIVQYVCTICSSDTISTILIILIIIMNQNIAINIFVTDTDYWNLLLSYKLKVRFQQRILFMYDIIYLIYVYEKLSIQVYECKAYNLAFGVWISNIEFKSFRQWYLNNKCIIIWNDQEFNFRKFSVQIHFSFLIVEYKFKMNIFAINSYDSVHNSNALLHLAATERSEEHHHKNYQLFKIK